MTQEPLAPSSCRDPFARHRGSGHRRRSPRLSPRAAGRVAATGLSSLPLWGSPAWGIDYSCFEAPFFGHPPSPALRLTPSPTTTCGDGHCQFIIHVYCEIPSCLFMLSYSLDDRYLPSLIQSPTSLLAVETYLPCFNTPLGEKNGVRVESAPPSFNTRGVFCPPLLAVSSPSLFQSQISNLKFQISFPSFLLFAPRPILYVSVYTYVGSVNR